MQCEIASLLSQYGPRRTLGVLACGAWLMLSWVGMSSAHAASPAPGWTIRSVAQPTNFSVADNESCEGPGLCDSYALTIMNVGASQSSGTIAIRDTLPSGVVVHNVTGRDLKRGRGEEFFASNKVTCSSAPVECTYAEPVPPGDALQITVRVTVTEPTAASVLNHAEVIEGEDLAAVTSEPATLPNTVNGGPTSFGFQDFTIAPTGVDGRPDEQAGDHPNSLTTAFDFTTDLIQGAGNEEQAYIPIEDPKTISIYLPEGLIGDAQALPRCPEAQLEGSLSGHGCPINTRVGTIVIATQGVSSYSQQVERQTVVSDIYNLVPEDGYPAEFGFRFVSADVLMYAAVVPAAGGYRVRITTPNLPHAAGIGFKVDGVSVTFFGDPAREDGATNGSSAFLANPTACEAGPIKARIEANSWVNPGTTIAQEVPVYREMTGCDALQFHPALELAPETSQVDKPSGYEVGLEVPQAPNVAPNLATPELENADVELPEGVSISPGAGAGLLACDERGAEGIELGDNNTLSSEVQEGEDLGADGMPHASRGHCPPASTLASVEVVTPLLDKPLRGHLYLAQPHCGGEDQPACTEASATNGELYGVYLEVGGEPDEQSGVIIKQRGTISANPTTGQLTARFDGAPQLPFSALKVLTDGGPRGPLANPQVCGPVLGRAHLVPWSTPVTPDATLSSAPFDITGCGGPMPFSPSFAAGSVTPSAGAPSAFTVTLSRTDGEQDFSSANTTLPRGLVGMLAQVPPCVEALANSGGCPEASRIGTTTVAAGAGPAPLWLSGKVYLTGPYAGGPFGLSLVVPAKAGPFDLGNVVVRAAIHVDLHTAAVTVASSTIPQIRDGVPFRLKTINVTIDRPGFVVNPTNCDEQSVTGTVTAAQGAIVDVSTPFAVANCATLPFKPGFSVLTSAKHSKKNGASLHVVVKSGAGQANIGSVKVNLPKQLPSRLSTLKLACLEKVFDANPAACPAGSKVGGAMAYTPVLPVALKGPAYFVSHGGAAFPDLVVVLQGDGVTVELTGNTFISKAGITSSTFATVPDVPITRFDLVLPTGAHSALAGNGSFCTGAMYMPTQIKGQNGAVVKQKTKIAVTGCPKPKKKAKAKAKKKK